MAEAQSFKSQCTGITAPRKRRTLLHNHTAPFATTAERDRSWSVTETPLFMNVRQTASLRSPTAIPAVAGRSVRVANPFGILDYRCRLGHPQLRAIDQNSSETCIWYLENWKLKRTRWLCENKLPLKRNGNVTKTWEIKKNIAVYFYPIF